KAHRWATLLGTPAAGWAATAIATLIAALIRLPGLDNVHTLIFDETYYVKDAWSLLTLGYEGTWPQNYDPTFAAGNTSGLSATASYAVHPPTGKWLIALGMQIFGQANPVGWRITTAICGVITVLLLCRLAHNLFRNPALTLIAGLFLATDGMAIVMSRTSILDGFLTMFSLAAFLCFVKDQQMSRPTLERKLRSWERIGAPRAGWRAFGKYLTLRDWRGIAIGPNAGNRPWLLAAGILSGLACSVKWSGIYVLACLGLFVALREITCRWRAGHPSPIIGALLADVWWAFILMVPTAILTYIASWFSWFTHPQAYGHGRSGISGFGGALVDLWIYH
ncbi:MAG: phospholipid carrier-dependent glycosyltransferase, partial [Actinomyces bouchesdurhonensis]|nr:phospholipid carrier-dependent glycosyltransferase [Actinomyces bouchesdurhonensis]